MTAASTKALPSFVLALACFLILLAPWALNRAPFYWFGDSFAYLHGGATALKSVAGIETRYHGIREDQPDAGSEQTGTENPAPASPATIPAPAPGASRPASADEEYRVSGGRSVYYAIALVAISACLGPHGPAIIAAALTALSLTLMARTVLGGFTLRSGILLSLGLSFSAAGVFTGLLLPDFLAPLGLMGVALALAFWPKLKMGDKVFWMVVITLAVVAHNTHLAIYALLAIVMFPFQRLFLRKYDVKSLAFVLLPVVIGIAANTLAGYAIERKYGYRPLPLPMIAASLFVDGPGREYLEKTCPENGLIYCEHLTLHPTEVDQYLWSTDPDYGAYTPADTATRQMMSRQQWDFLSQTLSYDFWWQVRASTQKALRQIADNSLTQLGFNARNRAKSVVFPQPDRTLIENSRSYQGSFPFQFVSVASQIVLWSSLALLAGLMTRLVVAIRAAAPVSARGSEARALIYLVVTIMMGIVLNAALTGAASQPQGRYSARMAILIPNLLALTAAWFLERRTGQRLAGADSSSRADQTSPA